MGHSLGGGIASAAAARHGAPATTFNAAGLHDKTAERDGIAPNTDNVDAIYVDGDILSGIQDNTTLVAPRAAGNRTQLSPADSLTWADVGQGVAAGALVTTLLTPIAPNLGVVAGFAAAKAPRGVRLHLMSSVIPALDKRMDQIEFMRAHRGCK